jgi:hypothetical protein
MGRSRQALGALAAIGLIACGESSSLLEPSSVQASEDGNDTHGSTDAHGL